MEKKKPSRNYTAEFRARGVRLFEDCRRDYASDNAAFKAIAPELGCSPDSLRIWCQRAETPGREIGTEFAMSTTVVNGMTRSWHQEPGMRHAVVLDILRAVRRDGAFPLVRKVWLRRCEKIGLVRFDRASQGWVITDAGYRYLEDRDQRR